MRITWVNHASLIIEHGDLRLLTDPWLSGTAFDDGWRLLSPSPFVPEDLPPVTHLWLSHEHPDHFHPPTLRAIPPGRRSRITVLFQATRDRKVVDYCRELGFGRVVELPPGAWHQLTPEVRVACQPVPDDDSWLAVDAGGELLLNLNDCMIRSPEQAEDIRGFLGRAPDVLLTQFSYACWVGNRDEPEKHRAAAREVLDRVRVQCRVLEPRFAIPFASFVRFCHEENAYLNAEANSVFDAAREISEQTSAVPIVLYPGESWRVGAPHDTVASIDRYIADARAWDTEPDLVPTQPVEILDLVAAAGDFRARLLAANGDMDLRLLRKAGLLHPAHIWLSDHERAVGFSLERGLAPSRRPRERCDAELTADALRYCFEHLWGGDTLLVNGRFQVPPGGDFRHFRRYLALAGYANHGRTYRDYARERLRGLPAGIASRALAAVRRRLPLPRASKPVS